MTTSVSSTRLQMRFSELVRNPILLFATGFGAGLMPWAPGTWGTLVAVLLCWLAQLWLSNFAFALLTLLLFLFGVWLCERTNEILQTDDHAAIVWDEFVGFFITMIAAPSGVLWLVVGFVLFRLFDIVKPWPVNLADKKLKGGFGVMADDVLAGAYAWLSLQIIVFLLARSTGG